VRQRWDRWQDEMVGQLEPGETPIAAGRALVGTYAFVIVTDRRVLWTGSLTPPTGEQIAFDEVTAFAEGTFDGHRYVLALRHRPLRFMAHVARWNIAWFHWGNAHVLRKRTETRFGFSRAGTEAALALRQQLASRELPTLPLTLPKQPARQPLLVVLAAAPIRCVAYWVLRLTGRIHAPPRRRPILSRQRLSRTTSRRTPPGQDPSAE